MSTTQTVGPVIGLGLALLGSSYLTYSALKRYANRTALHLHTSTALSIGPRKGRSAPKF